MSARSIPESLAGVDLDWLNAVLGEAVGPFDDLQVEPMGEAGMYGEYARLRPAP